MDKRIRWRIMTILWCILIFYFTASPNYTYEGTKSYLSDLIADEQAANIINIAVRKLAHATSFGLLAFFVYLARKGQRLSYFFAWFFSTIYGASDEFHQAFVPGRGSSVYDVILDSMGALIVLCAVYIYNSYRKDPR